MVSTAVSASAIARVLGIKTEFKDLRGAGVINLPQRIAVIGQGSSVSVYDNTKRQITSALEAAELYGFGSPVHLVARQLFPVNGDGVGVIPVTVYPLDDDGAGVVAAGDITPVVAATASAAYQVVVNNIASLAFVVDDTDTIATVVTSMTDAINAVLEMPVIAVDSATKVDLTSKWEGASANDIFVAVEGPADLGVTFGITQLTGGLVNPDVQPALDQVGDVWETLFINCMDVADTATLDLFSTFGEGRWGALTRKPMMAFVGNLALTPALAIVVPDARKTDRTNVQLVAPGSVDLPFVVAARQLARIAVVANENPPHDYGSQAASGLVPGDDGDQWDYLERDLAVKAGSSTIEVKDSVVFISDTITFYHPTGDQFPAYRYVVDVVRLQNIIFNLNLIFATPEWDGAPLIPDDQVTTNRDAKKPKTAKGEVAALLDRLGLAAIISDVETAKDSIVASISETNPKRLDLEVTVQLSGNTNIISVDLNFGFFFGQAAIVA